MCNCSKRIMLPAYMAEHAGECVKISDDGQSFVAVDCGGSSYLVYTALLNQTTINTTSGLLEIGKTYIIQSLEAGDDFENVGYQFNTAPFVATGTTPTTWTNGTVVTNATDSAPVADIKTNTLGGVPVWKYNNLGDYRLTLAGMFDEDNVFVFLANNVSGNFVNGLGVSNSPDEIYFQQINITSTLSVDGLIYQGIEIRVYP